MSGITVASWILGSVLVVMTLLFIFRIVLTWYPEVNLSKLPLSLIAWPDGTFFSGNKKDCTADRRGGHYADYLGGYL
jgi:YggT family protein